MLGVRAHQCHNLNGVSRSVALGGCATEFIVWVETRLAGKTLEIHEVAKVDRVATGIGPEELGLTLADGKTVLKQVQERIVQNQIEAISAAAKACQHCGRNQRMKDLRTRQLRTVFGAVNGASAIMGENHEDEKNSERSRWDYEEISGYQISRVIFQEDAPRLGRWLSMPHHVLGDGGSGSTAAAPEADDAVRGSQPAKQHEIGNSSAQRRASQRREKTLPRSLHATASQIQSFQ